MSDQDLIDDEIRREGGFRNQVGDPGGRTQYGISEKSFPAAWADNQVTLEEAREIYRQKFLQGWRIELIPHEALKHQVLDFSINSGLWGIKKLQQILGVPDDGVIGPSTLAAIARCDPHVVNNRLVDERVQFICRLVQKRPAQLPDLFGLVTRALSFRLP